MTNQLLGIYSVCVTAAAALAITGIILLKQKSASNQGSKHMPPLTNAPLESDKALVERYIQIHKDFPKKGIVFRDIFPVMRSAPAVEALIRLLADRAKQLGKIDMVVGLESRGFLFGPILAMILGCGFAPVRKPGKLPGQVISATYEKEYGKDTFEMQAGSINARDRVLVVDDLIATGGSLAATIQLVESMQAQVVECMAVIELVELNGRANVKAAVWSLFQF